MMTIRVPATTANMGPGFDCTGMALNIYNELTAEESDRLSINITGGTSASMPVTKDNLIYTTISRTFARMGKPAPNLRITQKDSIPVARGLGSSAACIVAGLLAANELCGGGCSRDELARMACSIEGHPDNVVPAMLGGLVTGAADASELRYVRIEPSDELSFALFIPSFKILTENARGVLPAQYTRSDVVFNTARASLFIASMMSGNWDNLRTATQDKLHQPYRSKLIPDMDGIIGAALELGAKGAYLSGAGPTITAILLRKHEGEFVREMSARLADMKDVWELRMARADKKGAQILRSG